MLRFDDDHRTLELGVHDLIDAGPPAGHLRLQVAWSARTRMRAGQAAHTDWQAKRADESAAFQREVSIKHRMVVRGWEVTIQGRMDGLTEEGDHLVVEELKSSTLPAERLQSLVVEDVHAWALQLRLYLWFLASQGRPAVGRLVVVSLHDGARRVLQVDADPDIADWVGAQLDWLLLDREDRIAWRARRRAAPVPFPHAAWRRGQEALAKDAADALRRGRHLLLGAPTGYGKTAAALHAALTVARDTGQRVFFATARTTQQAMAARTVTAMAAAGLPIRAVAIRAREKICLNEVVACRPDCCPYADRYHDKVARGDLLDQLWGEHMGTPAVDAIVDTARDHVACPFALTLDLVGRADLVIGDLNYVFDPSVRLAELSDDLSQWIVVVDEAHNLPERAIGYGSPELRLVVADGAADALRTGPLATRAGPFAAVAEDLAEWLRAGVATVSRQARDGEESGPVDEVVDRRHFADIAARFEALALDYALLKAEQNPFGEGAADLWLDCARAVSRMRSALLRAGDETVAIWRRGRGRRRTSPARSSGQLALLRPASAAPDPFDPAGLKLLCREPAKLLGPVFEGLGASLCMSATLDPPAFYQAMLGLPADRSEQRREPCPFPPERRMVRVCAEVSTAWRDRERDRERTAALVSEAVAAVPGNVAVFFPSFAFRDAVLPLLQLDAARPLLVQPRGMPEADRARFIATLEKGDNHVLLAVLGGIFSEGIDLPGDALLGAVIVGPALPQANLERRLLQQWYESRHGEGFRYAWLVPGMCRVVQAAGRVVRTADDRGVVVLVGQRFRRSQYAELLPEEWRVGRSRSGLLGTELADFFAETAPGAWPDEPPLV